MSVVDTGEDRDEGNQHTSFPHSHHQAGVVDLKSFRQRSI